jgi:hypothetical protein
MLEKKGALIEKRKLNPAIPPNSQNSLTKSRFPFSSGHPLYQVNLIFLVGVALGLDKPASAAVMMVRNGDSDRLTAASNNY